MTRSEAALPPVESSCAWTARVAVDASSAVTGGGIRYLVELLPLLRDRPEIDLGPVLVRAGGRAEKELRERGIPVTAAPGRAAAGTARWRYEVERSGSDLVYVPTEIGFGRYEVPVVFACRNALLWTWQDANLSRPMKLKLRAMRAVARRCKRRAAGYVAVSHYAKELAQASLGISPDRIRVIYHGGPHSKDTRQPRPKGRFLFVGDLYPHKHLEAVLTSLAGIEPPWRLEVVGGAPDSSYGDHLRSLAHTLGISEAVHFRGYLVGSELDLAYDRSSCLVWTSSVETFGHPLIEAAAAGLDIIASDTPVNREIAGSRASYFPLSRPEELQGKMREHLSGQTVGGELPRTYDWGICAEQLSSYFRQLLLASGATR